MNRTSSNDEAETVDVVTRTLRAVAEATPVATAAVDLDLALALALDADVADPEAMARGLSEDELLRVTDGVRAVDWPADDRVRVVAEGDIRGGGGMSYSLQWADSLAGMEGERPCVTLIVDGATIGPLCGFVHPEVPFSQIGPAARNDDLTLIWGVLGSGVATITSDDPTVPSVAALPLDPADPNSMRYALVPLPRAGDGSVTLTLRDPGGQPLHSLDVDPDGPIGG